MTIVTDQDRPAFLEKHFKTPLFDLSVFTVASHLIDGYSGGYWEFVENEQKPGEVVPFLQLSGEGNLTVKNAFSDEKVVVDRTLAGMIVTCFSVLSYIENGRQDLVSLFDRLKDAIVSYCAEHQRMDVWWAIMD